jgi:salicylate 5-hydroxylase small subunit
MEVLATTRTLGASDIRRAVEELHADYAAALNEERFEDWLDFFVEACVYKIIPRENWERGLPLATWHSESKGYLRDRVVGIRKTSVYGPRVIRRLVTGTRIVGLHDGAIEARADYAAFETLPDQLTRVFNVGEYRDRIVVADGRLKFQERLCIFDSVLVPNSLVYPL